MQRGLRLTLVLATGALALGVLAALALGVARVRPAAGATIDLTVTSAADPGDGSCDESCTLRDAILAANTLPGPQRIVFAIEVGPVVIRLNSPLPNIKDGGTIVDGTTQPESPEPPEPAGRPLVMIDGGETEQASGLVASAADVEFIGLGVGNFPRYGLAAAGPEAINTRFSGNWVGLAPDGRSAAPNLLSGIAIVAGASGAQIGGTCTGCGNRIAGNSNSGRTGHGILVAGPGSVGVRIVGNVIGLDAEGAALPNDDGILVVDSAHASIGGREPSERNIISGNRVAGIEVRDSSLLTIRMEGNTIGLDENGQQAVGNDVGVFIHSDARNVIVGAGLASAANVISGNRVGIAIEHQAHDISVQGNLIGLDMGGTAAVGNSEDGISIIAGAHTISVGGRLSEEGNWIAGNGNGIVISDASTNDIEVQGNVLGLALDGQTAVENQTGITVSQASEVVIGGREAGAGNVIVASVGSGVVLSDVAQGTVQGNRIGLRSDDAPVANGVGLVLENGTRDTIVEANRIGGNVGAGVQIAGDSTRRNRISQNVFLNNGGIGIDLGGDGVTANDPDDNDAGPNLLLNTPEILDVTQRGFVATVRGTGPARAHIELYRLSPPLGPTVTPHPSGFGPGGEFLAPIRANDSGEWEIDVALGPGAPITAITIDGSGNTSEFARNFFSPPLVRAGTGFTPVGWFGPATAAAEGVASLGERLEALFRFERDSQTWEIFRAGLPFASSLATLGPGDALWALLGAGPSIVWEQPPGPRAARTVALVAGLNFTTWTGPGIAVGDAVAGLGEAVESLLRWNPLSGSFDALLPALPLPGQATHLQHNDVLWIRMRVAATWEQPAP